MTEQPTTSPGTEGAGETAQTLAGDVVGWVTLDEAAGLWEDVDEIFEAATQRRVLAAAHEAAVDYLRDADGTYTDPREEDPPREVPERWKVAQVMLARHVWARMRTGNSDSIGPDGYQLSTYPLVLEARSLLRPKRSPLAGLL